MLSFSVIFGAFTMPPPKEINSFFFSEHHTINTVMKNSFTLSITIVKDKWLINSVVSSPDKITGVGLAG